MKNEGYKKKKDYKKKVKKHKKVNNSENIIEINEINHLENIENQNNDTNLEEVSDNTIDSTVEPSVDLSDNSTDSIKEEEEETSNEKFSDDTIDSNVDSSADFSDGSADSVNHEETNEYENVSLNEDNAIQKEDIIITKENNDRPQASKAVFIWSVVVTAICSIAFIVFIVGLVITFKLLEGKPELNYDDLIAPNSSIIYDNNNNPIMELGTYLRENVDYEQMPNCLIDAFLAIEDSRYFEHFGFDIPRFSKAALGNFFAGDFSHGGGSTITMQLIKNTYFSIDAGEESVEAERQGMSGIKRKVQEIFLAIELDLSDIFTKQEIVALYINKVNYGNNIRGVQKAAEYYFGKDTNELNISESAFLAGLINSPNSYNPYNDLEKYNNIYLNPESNYLENATKRRNEVIDLMVYHGYISELEADLAKSIKIEDMLNGVSDNFEATNEKYQSYIDAVIDEVIEMTGENPYDVGMEIHTNMNAYMQELIYDIQNEAEYTNITFPNELCQSAIVLMDNQNGAIEALGGGRGKVDSARQFNRATSAYINPGSSFKPIVDYGLAFEALGWATSHTITDMPYYLYNGNVLISNYDRTYIGDMLLTEALGRSQNTTAVQALAAVVSAKGEEYVIDYLNSIGFDFEYEDFDLQFAIGGNRCIVTPLQLAAAHAIFINGGMYIKPHTINYITYTNKEKYVADTVGTRAMSDASAYLTAYLENYNMEGPFSSLMWYCKKDYPLYGKTGTTDWGSSGREYGIPNGATKDSWLVMQTNRYTISCWTGYDKLEKGAYFSNSEYRENTKSKIVDLILIELEEHHTGEYDPYTGIEMPDSVTEITHVKGAYPYAYPTAGYQSVTGLIAKSSLENQPLVSVSEALKDLPTKVIRSGISNVQTNYDGTNLLVTFQVSNSDNINSVGETCDISATNAFGRTTTAYGRIWFPHYVPIYQGSVTPPYTYNIYSGGNLVSTGTTNATSFVVSAPGLSGLKACVLTADSPEVCVRVN